MKIDFHTHGKLAKKLPFSPIYTEKLFRKAYDSGLDALCLTEHFNTISYRAIFHYLVENYERIDDYILVEGVKIFCGMEIDIIEGGHILVIGTYEDMIQLNIALEPNKQGNFLTFTSLIELLTNYDVIVGAAHPYRQGSNIPLLPIPLLQKLDFIDLNGKDYALYGKKGMEDVETLSLLLNKPVIAGSDTHQSFQYGCIFNEFNKNCSTILELRNAIVALEYSMEILDYINFKVETATTLKKALKTIHSCGGDYISVL